MAKKYIDSEKLIAEIEKRIIEHRKSLKKDITSISEATLKGSLCAYKSIEHFIDSLQQEQPEVDLEKEIKDWCDENITGVRPIYTADSLIYDLLPKTARHFWNKGYNARKEE